MPLNQMEKRIYKELVKDKTEKFKRGVIADTSEISSYMDLPIADLRIAITVFAEAKLAELEAEQDRISAKLQRITSQVSFLENYLGEE